MIIPAGRERHRLRRQQIIKAPVHAREYVRHIAHNGEKTTFAVTINAWKRTSMTKQLGPEDTNHLQAMGYNAIG